MLVKDQITGEKIDKATAYCVESISSTGKKGHKYYSSKEAYDNMIAQKKNRQQCIDEMYEVLGYQSFMKIPTFFYKKLSEWEPYGYDVVLDCICTNESSIEWALNNKEFKQETAKIMYICAIIENHINDSLKAKKNKVKQEQKEKMVDVVDIDLNIHRDIRQKTKDISKFLEED